MVTLEKENILFLNQALDYIRGPNNNTFLETGNEISPTRVELRPGHRNTLTGAGYNKNLNLQIPSIHEVEWEIPEGPRWTNRDMTVFGYLLSLAPIRFKPSRADLRHPLPSEFIVALVKEFGGNSGVTKEVITQFGKILRGLALLFREADSTYNGLLGGGYHASTLRMRYQAFADADLMNRSRFLGWTSLPDVHPEGTRLVPSDEPGYKVLTWPQDGFVTPTVDQPIEDYNALIRAHDTRLKVLNAEITVPIFQNAARQHVPVYTACNDVERIFGRPVWSIVRPVTQDYIDALSHVSDAVRDGLASGELKIDNTLHMSFGEEEPELKSLNVIPSEINPDEVKTALLVGANDRITLE